MHSMDYEEFLWAKGCGPNTVEDLYAHIIEARPFSDLEMEVFSSLFMDYCILGGMPAVVSKHVASGSFEGTLATQRQLIVDYQEDIRKYADGMDQTRILNVFEHIPVQLAKENKKFQITKVARGARFKDYRGCIEWLDPVFLFVYGQEISFGARVASHGAGGATYDLALQRHTIAGG